MGAAIRYLSLVLTLGILLVLSVARAQADPTGALIRGQLRFDSLQAQRRAAEVEAGKGKAAAARAVPLIEALSKAEKSKAEIDSEVKKLPADGAPELTPDLKKTKDALIKRSADLAEEIAAANELLTPEKVRAFIAEATQELNLTADATDAALSELGASPTPDDFVNRSSKVIAKGSDALRAVERYESLPALAKNLGLSDPNDEKLLADLVLPES